MFLIFVLPVFVFADHNQSPSLLPCKSLVWFQMANHHYEVVEDEDAAREDIQKQTVVGEDVLAIVADETDGHVEVLVDSCNSHIYNSFRIYIIWKTSLYSRIFSHCNDCSVHSLWLVLHTSLLYVVVKLL